LALVVPALAGCAPAHAPWTSPQASKSQADSDWSACRRQAEADILGYQPDDAPDTPVEAADRAQARRRIDSAVADCMIGLGYVPARKGN
jgi:hypothetical protein